MASAGVGHIVLEGVSVLAEDDSLSVSPERKGPADLNSGRIVVESWSVYSDIGEAEGFMLINIHELPGICELRLVQKVRIEQISVGEREVAEVIRSEYGESRTGWTAEVGDRERFVVVTVGKEEADRELALVGLQPIAVGHELFFIEGARDTEGTGSLGVKWLCRIDPLRRWNQVTSIS